MDVGLHEEVGPAGPASATVRLQADAAAVAVRLVAHPVLPGAAEAAVVGPAGVRGHVVAGDAEAEAAAHATGLQGRTPSAGQVPAVRQVAYLGHVVPSTPMAAKAATHGPDGRTYQGPDEAGPVDGQGQEGATIEALVADEVVPSVAGLAVRPAAHPAQASTSVGVRLSHRAVASGEVVGRRRPTGPAAVAVEALPTVGAAKEGEGDTEAVVPD